MDYALMRERLVKAREFIGQNRKEFAETLNMSYRTITNYENGSREPGSDYLARVADVCGCTTDWLLGLSDDARCCSPHSSLLAQGSDPQYGEEPKLKQISKNKSLSEFHQRALAQLEKMNDEQVKAVLAFINSLDDIEKAFSADNKPGE